MTDQQAVEGQEPDTTQPVMGEQEPAPEATPTAQDAGADDQQALTLALKEARADAAKYRKRLRDAEAAQQAAQDAELTESERNAKRVSELEQTLAERDQQTRSLALESAVAVRSNALGIVDAEVAVALIDRSALEFDDAGRPDPEGLDQALRRLIKAKPYLKQAVAPASPANPARSEPVGESDAQRRARLFGGGGGMFDPDTAARLGGGVVNTNER